MCNCWQSTAFINLSDLWVAMADQCVAWPALFIHEELDLRFIVHGDDFVCLGDSDALLYLENCLKTRFEYRIDGLIGPEEGDGT